ncbi:MAG: hypothetical protein NVS4B11_20370 [Ktedonobacteraceae bacterium]
MLLSMQHERYGTTWYSTNRKISLFYYEDTNMVKTFLAKQDRKYCLTRYTWLVLFGCLVIWLSGCGTPPPAKNPLSNEVDTPTVEGTSAAATAVNSHINPIQITQSNLVTYPGGKMTMTIATSPSAQCTFIVDYGRGKSSSAIGTGPQVAKSDGTASWTWQVDSDAKTGLWPMTIVAEFTGSTVKTTMTVNVTVTLPPITVVSPTSISAPPKSDMTLTIATAPHVLCTLGLNFGPSRPIKYVKSGSDANGVATWTWHVDAAAPAGTWPLSITVTLADGEQASSQVNMTIL